VPAKAFPPPAHVGSASKTFAGVAPFAALFPLAALLSGCAGGARHAAVWDGRRGYDGNGDYGYDLEAPRAEARGYRASAGRAYPVPGTADDPWGPHVRDAAARFRVPERWVREVMRQESGGRLYGGDGLPITSPTGRWG
jgi:soluble lytic murein transglycosylase-like protein